MASARPTRAGRTRRPWRPSTTSRTGWSARTRATSSTSGPRCTTSAGSPAAPCSTRRSAGSSTPCGTSPARRLVARLPAAGRQVPREGAGLPGRRRRRAEQLAENARAAVEKYGYTAVKMLAAPAGHACRALQRGHPCGGQRDRAPSATPWGRTSTSPSTSTRSSSSSAAPYVWPRRSSPISRSGSRSRSGPRTSMPWRSWRRTSSVPLASGECNYTKYEFQPILPGPGTRHHPARYLPLRRRAGDEEDRRHGRGPLRRWWPRITPWVRWRTWSTPTSPRRRRIS